MKTSFIFPNLDNLSELPGASSDKILVISIIGKSPINKAGLKVKSVGRVPLSSYHNAECSIDGSYDEENQILYLHVQTLLDTDVLIRYYKSLEDKPEYENAHFFSIYDEVKSNFARYLLFLFYVSHIVILSHPGYTLDSSYMQYFKAADNLSQKLVDKIKEALRSKEQISPELVTNGRFCTPRLVFYFEKCPKNVQNLKKLEHNLEDKIYHILRKTRIISTMGGSLFAIPLNDEFVHISQEPASDPLGSMVRGLIMDCQPGGAMQIDVPYSSQLHREGRFKKFLQVYIQQARSKGFDDCVSSGRHQHSVPAYFELPTLKKWIDFAKIVHSVTIKNKLISSLCIDTRFSEQRCLKVLPLALARYQEGLPSHYAKSGHEARLNMAFALLKTQARGPAYLQYAQQLEIECQSFWENGRQQCEAASMTGNPCKLPKHGNDKDHISGFVYKSACDCGRKICPREDPYTIKQANYTFYQQAAKECQCSKLERIPLPVFEPSVKEFKEANLKEWEDTDTEASDTPENYALCDLPRRWSQVPSTVEFLPGMLTLTSPTGLLPEFQSWSLVCLGASSLYSHNLGLSESHHPGFLSSTNYLLPWDVTVYPNSKQNWPHVSKYAIRGRRGRQTGSMPQFTVKVFIGVEYECSLGHRFMLAAPDRILKATPGSIVKDTGHKIAESDLPLYYPCPCRGGKLAQLMRLHVVTPKAPVNCTLNPKVQPAAGSPIFVSTLDGPIKLTQSAYWIMRLPYVYVADKQHYSQNPSAKLLKGVFGITEIDQ
nr:unnamed protein product [Callosobruchus chinensis]